MQYAEISEVWNSPLSNKIKEMEDNQRAFSNQALYSSQNLGNTGFGQLNTDDDNIVSAQSNTHSNNAKLVTNAGYIMPAGSLHAEPIQNYLKNELMSNQKKSIETTSNMPNRPIRSRAEETRIMDAMDDDLEELPQFISSNIPKHARTAGRTDKRTLYKKRDYDEEDNYYKKKLNKIYKNDDENTMCDKVEKHMRTCFYCHEKYKKNDNLTLTLDPKNILLISILVLTILFIFYHVIRK